MMTQLMSEASPPARRRQNSGLENCLSVNDGVRGIGGPGAPGPQFQGDPELYHTSLARGEC